MRKRSALWMLVCGVVVAACSKDAEPLRTVRVVRGAVARDALAVGRVEAESQVEVKSLLGGTVRRLFVRAGQKVETGDPLCEVRPVTTALTLVEAERAVAAARDGEAAAKEFVDGAHAASYLMRLMQGGKSVERMYRSATTQREQAEERLRLLQEGKADSLGREVDYVVRAPVAGHVLARGVREGNPVVPASNFGSGTVLVTIADLDRFVFRGTVDEIDVGKLEEGMEARVTLGALPAVTLRGRVKEIGLRATRKDNSVVFDVELILQVPAGLKLRSGYSSVARIRIDARDDVLVIPERVVEFVEGKARVLVPGGQVGEVVEKVIEVGLSDGLTIEVLAGLEDGDTVVERN